MMLDVAGGIIIVGMIAGVFYVGWELVSAEEPVGWVVILAAVLAIAWILLVHTGILKLPI
jgi:hypothetical protein